MRGGRWLVRCEGWEEWCYIASVPLHLQAFGAPFIVAHVGGEQETFFGSDRFEILAHALGMCLPDRQTDVCNPQLCVATGWPVLYPLQVRGGKDHCWSMQPRYDSLVHRHAVCCTHDARDRTSLECYMCVTCSTCLLCTHDTSRAQ